MSITVTYNAELSVAETLDTGVPDVSRPTLVHSAFNSAKTFTATADLPSEQPPCTKVSSSTPTLVAGAKTIDLTALPGTNGAVIDGTGLKVQSLLFSTPKTNLGNVTLNAGAANGYNLLGAAWKMILPPGSEILLRLTDSAPDVAAGAKNIDLAGTGTEAFKLVLVLG